MRIDWKYITQDGNHQSGMASTGDPYTFTTMFTEIIENLRAVKELGVLIIGPDQCILKDYISDKFRWFGRVPNVRISSYPVMVLDGERSCSHTERHNAVASMMDEGVRNVVMVYVKKSTDALSMNPPTLDGLAGLITVTEEE